MKNIFKKMVLSLFICLFFCITPLQAAIESFLPTELGPIGARMPLYDQLYILITSESEKISSQIDSMKDGVIKQIGDELKTKSELTKKLQTLSQVDYVTNKETLFLLQKLNNIKDISVDTRNTTTGTLNTLDNFSLNKFKKDLGNAENFGNSDIFGKDKEMEDLEKVQKATE